MRKYWWVGAAVVVLIVVVGAVFGWRAQAQAQDEKWKKATDYFGRAEYEKANKELEGLDIPKSPERLRVYAQTKLATRELDDALTSYQKLYDINKDPSVQLIIGNIYNEQKRYDDAIKVYREAIAANPSNTQAYVNLATLYRQQSNSSEAAKVAAEGVKNNPGSATLHELQVSMLLENKNSTEYKDAVAALKKVSPESALLTSLGIK